MDDAEITELLELLGENAELDDPDYVPVENHDISSDSDDFNDPINVTSEPITRDRTRRFLEGVSDDEVFDTCLDILSYMGQRRIDLAIFLDMVMWGNEAAIANNKFRYARSTLLTSEAWPHILRRCRKPPGANTGKGTRRSQVMDEFVMEAAGDLVVQDMKSIAKIMKPLDDPLSKESLTNTDLSELAEHLLSEEGAPHLAYLLRRAGWSKKQAERNTHKTPKNVSESDRQFIQWLKLFIGYSHHHLYAIVYTVSPS